MVDEIYRNAAVKRTPSPIPPSPAMTTVPVFLRHNETVLAQPREQPLGALVAGHKKDVVIANSEGEPGAEDPDTIQVERNGFIEGLLSETTLEGAGYTYLGDRVYERFIGP